MSYIVIETHGGPEFATICTEPGGSGSNLVFEHYRDARNEADDCQDGLVISLDGAPEFDDIDILEMAAKIERQVKGSPLWRDIFTWHNEKDIDCHGWSDTQLILNYKKNNP